MRIFVTGSTGFMGRALIADLLEHEHEVVGLARTDAARDVLSDMGAYVYEGQARNTGRLGETICNMNAVVHLATTIPTSDDADEDRWAHTSKIITGMLQSILTSTEGCPLTVIFPSIFSVYGNHGDNWVTEQASLASNSHTKAYLDAEKMLLEATARNQTAGVILRMGQVYGPNALHTKGLIYALKRAQAPVMSGGQMYWPILHVRDAVQAIRRAIEESPAGEIFNVCDDEPVRQAVLYDSVARWAGGPPPPRKGTAELRPYMGRMDAPTMKISVRMSNKRSKERLGFRPHFPSYREGYQHVLRQLSSAEEAPSAG